MLRSLIGITKASAMLPAPTVMPLLADNTPGFSVDLRGTATPETPCNAAWIARSAEILIQQCQASSLLPLPCLDTLSHTVDYLQGITSGFAADAPAIDASAIKHALKNQFTYLKRKYKEQTHADAINKRRIDEHNGRWKSTQRMVRFLHHSTTHLPVSVAEV